MRNGKKEEEEKVQETEKKINDMSLNQGSLIHYYYFLLFACIYT